MKLTSEQTTAIELSQTKPVLVITGGPGTGKTTVCRQIIDMAQSHGRSVLCAAPTGKAAKRLSEQTGRPASTIHRLLRWKPSIGGFTVNEKNPFCEDVIIIDEMSMVGTSLFNSILKAVNPPTKLILVGDVDQLPSISYGNTLSDIINSGIVPVVRLTQIHRQSENSWISENAQRINTGQKIYENNSTSEDFFFFERETPEQVFDAIVYLITKIVGGKYKIDPIRDTQVLCPQWKSPVGVTIFNKKLQEIMNPSSNTKPEYKMGDTIFRQGDKVIHTRNNYSLGAFNGEVGIITDIDTDFGETLISVDFYDRIVQYENKKDIAELQLCYAMTIHKSQGSEYRAVIIPCHSTNSFMLSRPLLYTAVTRGKELVQIVGNRKGLNRAIRNNNVLQRNTLLCDRLRSDDDFPAMDWTYLADSHGCVVDVCERLMGGCESITSTKSKVVGLTTDDYNSSYDDELPF